MSISHDSKVLIKAEIDKVVAQRKAVQAKIDLIQAELVPLQKQKVSLNLKLDQLKGDIK